MNLFVSSNRTRDMFSRSMSTMYRNEVPQYGTLLDLVMKVNADTLKKHPKLQQELEDADEYQRLDVERHGAIRLGTPNELATMRRIFEVMGMFPVGYYDLSVAGVPVHATAFRPTSDDALRINPFRVFTSLLRLELISDLNLREQAQKILDARNIFTPRVIALTEKFETSGGLTEDDAKEFVSEVTKIFRWQSQATVDMATYKDLYMSHRLVADVVSFNGPHINHLTPRTLDIDAVQAQMACNGLVAKDVVEGPPRRRCQILLRQTSFKALEEPIFFPGNSMPGSHAARFGEIEQRGMALTRKGRALYDGLLTRVRSMGDAGSTAENYEEKLAEIFVEFPDDIEKLLCEQLSYFRYFVADESAFKLKASSGYEFDLEDFRKEGIIDVHPIIYEDFLPVSAAGIFQSNLGGDEQKNYEANDAKVAFELSLQSKVCDEFDLYERSQMESIVRLKKYYVQSAARKGSLLTVKPLMEMTEASRQ